MSSTLFSARQSGPDKTIKMQSKSYRRVLLDTLRDTFHSSSSSSRYLPLGDTNSSSKSSTNLPQKSSSLIKYATLHHIANATPTNTTTIIPTTTSAKLSSQNTSSSSSRHRHAHHKNDLMHHSIAASSSSPYSVLFIVALFLLFSSASRVVEAQSCGYPGSPAHAIVTMTNPPTTTSSSALTTTGAQQGLVATGTVATYTCDNGYELLGPARRLCNENGTWTPLGIPFCVLNVAVGKAAMQSSSVGQGTAQKAIDGSTSTFHNPSTCSMTEAEAQPWFYVNLLEPVLVQLVRIDFGSSCCGRAPATITVRVGNYRPDMGQNQVCNKFTGYIEEGRPLFLPCARPMPGAFVSVTLESAGNPLSICEMFVYTDHALSIEQCPSFRDQPLGSTSTYNGNCYIFYNHQPMTFPQAKTFCEKRGGSLVNQISPALQGFLSWELYRRHKNDKNGQYWLGVVRDTHNPTNWKWINGKDVTLSFWNLPGSQENCSRFDGTKGFLWSDTNCATKLNFMCQHRPLSCGKPERPVNSSVIASSTDVGATIEYRCAEGSMLIGPSLRTCLPNGFFSEFSPKCKYIECGYPASIANGHYMLHNNSRSFQARLTYHCQEGYVLVGRASLQCDADSRWNGPPPRCEPVLCPPPPMIVNGNFRSESNSTRFGSQVEYLCNEGYELVGERLITCNTGGYWDAQPGYCYETPTAPSTTSSTTSTTTPSTTTTTEATTTSTATPTTFFNPSRTNPSAGIWVSSTPDSSRTTKAPTIVLLPTGTSMSTSSSNTNPYTRGDASSSSSSVPNTTPTSVFTPSITTSTRQFTSRGKPTHRPPVTPPTTPRSTTTVNDRENMIPDSSSSKAKSKMASARLNMGGIIALGVFGGFVFLAAVITIIVIIIRRVKHSHSSLDAQTISTFDSSNGDNPGFYHKYASAWSQLQSSAAVLHSGSYKPASLAARLDPYSDGGHAHHAYHGHHQGQRGSRTNVNNNGVGGGTINEGFRDAGEITLNADVYTRSSSGGSGGSGGSGDHKRRGGRGGDHEWQHLTRAKY